MGKKKIMTKMMKMKSKKTAIILSLIFMLIFNGCFGVSGNFKNVRNDILDNFEGKYSREFEYSFGDIVLNLAGSLISLADDKDGKIAGDLLCEVSKVQVGIYERKAEYNKGDPKVDFNLLKETTDELVNKGWHYLVRAADYGEMTAVLFRVRRDNHLHKMFIINFSDEELVLAEISGNLDKIIESVVREKGQNLNLAVNY